MLQGLHSLQYRPSTQLFFTTVNKIAERSSFCPQLRKDPALNLRPGFESREQGSPQVPNLGEGSSHFPMTLEAMHTPMAYFLNCRNHRQIM